jgi:hypothetical protein
VSGLPGFLVLCSRSAVLYSSLVRGQTNTDFKRPSSAYGSQATVIIGNSDERRTLHVDHGLLTFYSGYFQAALSGRWTAAEDDAIRLDTENPKTFERFVSWLYTRSITDDDDEKATCQLIIDLWLFADRRGIPLLMNEMLDCLKERILTEKTIPTTLLGMTYERTMPGLALRRMLVHAITTTASERLVADDSRKVLWPKDALCDMMKKLLKVPRPTGGGVADYGKIDICPLFHIHEEGVCCARKGTKRSSEEMEE